MSLHDTSTAGALDLAAAIDCAKAGRCVVCGKLTLTVHDALRHFRQITEQKEKTADDPVAL